jgi:DNA primase
MDDIEATIRDVLSKYIDGPIRRAGPNNVVMRCPFHSDNSPSFAMSVRNGLYICYACGEKGGFRQFLAKVGLTRQDISYHFSVLLEQLRNNAPPPPNPGNPEGVIVADTNRHIPEELLGVFHRCPEMLLDEGFKEKTLLHFGVGVDAKHNRITFPLRDLEGTLVGVSGRAMEDSAPMRYKVYKDEYRTWDLPPYETDKSRLLWEAHRVLPAVMQPGKHRVVVVEGFKALMWLHQAKIPNVVALMTKYMSWTQQWILEKMGGPYVLMLDNDEAGSEGTVAITRALAKQTNEVYIAEYDERQPTDIQRMRDVRKVVENATNYRQMLV